MTVFIFSYLRYEDIKLGRQDSKILTCVFSERYGFEWFAFLVIFSVFFFFFPSVQKNVILLQSGKKRTPKKKISEEPVFYMAKWILTGRAFESHSSLCANKHGLISLTVPEKRNVSARFICLCLCLSKETQTQIHMFFSVALPQNIWEFGSRSRIPVAASKTGSFLRL